MGCAFSDKIIYYEYFKDNPDNQHPLYNKHYGIYQPNCGLDNVLFSFGHDEYLYQVLVYNKCILPPIALRIIRYHSFYPWHKDGAYEYLECEADHELKYWCKIFSECDLYTKSPDITYDEKELTIYYQNLCQKYFPKDILIW